MFKSKEASIVTGFVVLFTLYHVPEFFSAFWVMAVFKIGFLVAAFFLARAQGWKGLGGYGLSLKSKWGIYLLSGLLMGLAFFSFSFILSLQLGYEQLVTASPLHLILEQLPMILLMTAVPSIAEDILTRGYLFAHLSKNMKPALWVLLSAVIYVLNHIWRLNDGAAVLSYLFMLGLVLGYAVWMVKSLWLAFGIHWGANIAFEIIHATYETTPAAGQDPGNWLLALSWAMLLLLLLAMGLIKKRRHTLPSEALPESISA